MRSIQKWKDELREFLGLGDEPIEFCCDGKRKVVRGEPQPEVEKALPEPEERATEELEIEEVLEPENQAIKEEYDGTNGR